MSYASTLDQARDFLLLPPVASPADTLQAARDRRAEWQAKSADLKASVLARNGAARKLRQLEPMLPALEIETELAGLEQAAPAPGAGIHKLRIDHRQLSGRIAVLPDNDERTIFCARLKSVEALLNPPAPPTAPLPPAPGPAVDPARAALAAKFDDLRAALDRGESSKSRLTGLIGAARALASVVGDERARAEAAATIKEFEGRLQSIITARTRSPFGDPTARILATKLASLHTAVEQGKLSRASFLLEAARELAADLEDKAARTETETELNAIETRLQAALAAEAAVQSRVASEVEKRPNADSPPPPDPAEGEFAHGLDALETALAAMDLAEASRFFAEAKEVAQHLRGTPAREHAAAALTAAGEQLHRLQAELALEADREKLAAGTIAAVRAALDQRAPGRAVAALADARAASAGLRAGDVRIRLEAELVSLAMQVRQLEDEVRAVERREKALAETLAAVRAALDRGEAAGAAKLLEDARPLLAAMPSSAARDVAVQHVDELAARLNRLGAAQARRPQTGHVLRLVPVAEDLVTGVRPVALHFVARPRFILGRFSSEGASLADFSCSLAEKRVSRVHVTLSRKGEEILVCDGDGTKPSANGSKLDDEPLGPTAVPASFAGERTISLGPVFTVAVQHLPGPAGGPPTTDSGLFATAGKTMVVSLVSGCMRFLPKSDASIPALAIWIFTDASIGAAPGNAIALPNSGLGDVQCRVHYWQDAFWIENLRSGAAVRLGDRALAKNEAMPLNSGDVLHLGQSGYTVGVEA